MPSGHGARPYTRPVEAARALGYDDASPETDRRPALSTRSLGLGVAIVAALGLGAPACTGGAVGGSTGPTASPGAARPSSAPTSPAAPGRTFRGDGVAFTYPERWERLGLRDSSASAGSAEWTETVGRDGRNLVTVSSFALEVSITDRNLEARSGSIRSQLESLFVQAGGMLRSGPRVREVGGLPALAFTGTARSPSGLTVHSRLVLAFDGATEYFVNCQYDDAGRREILMGCGRVVSTFEVTG